MSRSDYWYAAQVTSGMEFDLEEEIKEKLTIGTAYCPRRSIRKKASRHAKKFEPVDVPLFSKYLFVKFGSSFQNWGVVTSLKGVDGFIRANGYPLPIRPASIELIRNECEVGAYNDKGIGGSIKVGDSVEVSTAQLNGNISAFGGMTGTFQGLVRDRSAAVELSLFGRSTRVEIPTELIERILR